MKARTAGRSVQLRVSEVEALASGQAITETVPFPEHPRQFSLELSETGATAACFDGALIRILISQKRRSIGPNPLKSESTVPIGASRSQS